MKHNLSVFVLLMWSISTFLIACGPNKKLKASKSEVGKSKKEKTAVNHKSTNASVISAKTEHITKVESIQPIPPASIEKIFKSGYPSAKEVVWAKEPSSLPNSLLISDYKVYFLLQENKNSLIYAENGELIETRIQILQEQLPPNIYSAIKKKYPDVYIVSVSTLRNINQNGSYVAVIRTQIQPAETEVILTEKGIFVE